MTSHSSQLTTELPLRNGSVAISASSSAKLHNFLRPNLDLLFVGLNPPEQSNANGHYFSGKGSRFFHLLYLSGLIEEDPDKSQADQIVFGSTCINYCRLKFGVVDLVEEVVETNSGKVKANKQHVDLLIGRIYRFKPRFVCVIHSGVREALNKHGDLIQDLTYGSCGQSLRGCESTFVLNYFPNGNNIADSRKIEIFQELREALVAE